jgi:uncharacterized protein YprB with RNaseH-like and TPR domain
VANEIYFDIETLRHSDEVPGDWSNVELFGISVAVTYDLSHGFRTWFEQDAQHLIKELASFSHIITFNGERFDFKVLSFYGAVDSLYSRSLDLCEIVRLLHGCRCSLNRLARDTIHRGKRTFSHPRYKGLGAPELWRVGETGRVARYCRNDVQLLVDLVSHIRSKGFVVINRQRQEMSWDLVLRTNNHRKRPSSPEYFRLRLTSRMKTLLTSLFRITRGWRSRNN